MSKRRQFKRRIQSRAGGARADQDSRSRPSLTERLCGAPNSDHQGGGRSERDRNLIADLIAYTYCDKEPSLDFCWEEQLALPAVVF